MPIGSIAYRDICNSYEKKTAQYQPDTQIQKQAHRISASQTQKSPKVYNLTSALYGSAVMLNCLSCVINSNISTHRDLPAQREKQGSTNTVSRNIVDLNNTFSTVTSSAHIHSPLSSSSTIISPPPSQTYRHSLSPTTPTKNQPTVESHTKHPISNNWFNLPMAAAQSPLNSMDGILWDEKQQEWIAETDMGKRKLLDVAQILLESTSTLSQSEINAHRLEWEFHAADTPVMMTALPLTTFHSRDKRISLKDRERTIIKHIEDNCAVEQQFTTPQGDKTGSTLLFIANTLDFSTKHLVENEAPQWKAITSKITDIGIFIVTLGLPTAIGSPLAALLRKTYFHMNGDPICATRFGHIAVASLGTSLNIGGTGGPKHIIPASVKPIELQNIVPFTPRATIISNNQETNIKTNLLLTAKSKSISGNDEKLLLLPKGDSEFTAVPLNPTQSSGKTIPVQYDAKTGIWHNTEITGGPLRDVVFTEGEQFISLQGQRYQLRTQAGNQYDIIANKLNGQVEYHSVYQEPISKTWHLKTENNRPIFTAPDRNIINQIEVKNIEKFQFNTVKNPEPHSPSAGPRFEMRNKQDDPKSIAPLCETIEINGSVVRVRKIVSKDNSESFNVIDPKVSGKLGRPVEWDGDRWRFQKSTSRYVSAALNRRITSDMFAKDLDENQLSSPDNQGICRAGKRGFLKVRGGYVEVHKDAIFQLGNTEGKRIRVYYKNRQFRPLDADKQMKLKQEAIAENFYGSLKDQSSQQLPVDIKFADIEKVTRAMLSNSHTKLPFVPLAASASGLRSAIIGDIPSNQTAQQFDITPITSNELNTKRYLITFDNDDDTYLIVDVSRNMKHFKVLTGEDSNIAMEKYQRSLSGVDIPTVFALKHHVDVPLFRANSRTEIDDIVAQRIQQGAKRFNIALERLKTKKSTDNAILVGHADFLSTSPFENNVFSSPKNAFKALHDFFLPLSRNYPDAIIIPGSIYISSDIPKGMKHKDLLYQRGEVVRKVGDAVNFSTVIVPVLYQGRFITIARKGECLTYTTADAQSLKDEKWLFDLDTAVPAGSTLKVNNVKYNPFSTPSEWDASVTGTIFAGKTQLPGERLYAEWFICPCLNETGATVDIDYFFKNEFIINNNKFLIVIEDEFIQQADTRPLIRRLAFPQDETVQDSNRYDWIIHPAVINELDDTLRSAANNYFYVPSHSSSLFYSANNERMLTRSTLYDEDLSIYEFSSNSNSSMIIT